MRRRLPRVRRGAVGPPGERWTPDSIQLPAILPNCVGYEARPASPDGLSAVTLEDLVSDALRMNPDRILVGECRGPETMAMLWAFATGHAGMTSVHGESAEHALRNLARFALTSGARIEAEQALDWLREIDVVIHCDRRRSFDGGERRFLPGVSTRSPKFPDARPAIVTPGASLLQMELGRPHTRCRRSITGEKIPPSASRRGSPLIGGSSTLPSFTITAASQKVTLDESGAAQVPFTVTNTSAQTLRGRLSTKPVEPAKSEWLSVVGESVRDFRASAAEQVIVQIRVPSGIPSGSYSFRLVAISETAPDQDFTKGPSIAFDVAASTPKRRFPWWLVRCDRARRRRP